jgi:hypothetical protein
MLDRIALCGVALFFSMASPAAFTAPSSEPMRLYDEVQSLRQHAGKFSDVEHRLLPILPKPSACSILRLRSSTNQDA